MVEINKSLLDAILANEPWECGVYSLTYANGGVYLKKDDRSTCALYPTSVVFSNLNTYNNFEMSILMTWLIFTNSTLELLNDEYVIKSCFGTYSPVADLAFKHMEKVFPMTSKVLIEYLIIPENYKRVIK